MQAINFLPRKTSTTTIFILLWATCITSCADNGNGNTKQTKLGKDIVVVVEHIRTYKTYDGRIPETDTGEKHREWMNSYSMDPKELKVGNIRSLPDIRKRVRSYSNEHAAGKYMELTILIENKGRYSETAIFSGNSITGWGVWLEDSSGKTIDLKAFMVPGFYEILSFPTFDRSLAAEPKEMESPLGDLWEADAFGVTLDPKERTWALLLFDIPKKCNSVRLHIKDAKPIKIYMPGP